MKFSVQFDYHGRHRILLTVQERLPVERLEDGTQYQEKTYTGEWADFRSIAILVWEGELDGKQVRKTYIAGTEYGLLPQSERVYEISSLATTIDKSMEYIDRKGKDHRAEIENPPFRPLPGGFEPH